MRLLNSKTILIATLVIATMFVASCTIPVVGQGINMGEGDVQLRGSMNLEGNDGDCELRYVEINGRTKVISNCDQNRCSGGQSSVEDWMQDQARSGQRDVARQIGEMMQDEFGDDQNMEELIICDCLDPEAKSMIDNHPVFDPRQEAGKAGGTLGNPSFQPDQPGIDIHIDPRRMAGATTPTGKDNEDDDEPDVPEPGDNNGGSGKATPSSAKQSTDQDDDPFDMGVDDTDDSTGSSDTDVVDIFDSPDDNAAWKDLEGQYMDDGYTREEARELVRRLKEMGFNPDGFLPDCTPEQPCFTEEDLKTLQEFVDFMNKHLPEHAKLSVDDFLGKKKEKVRNPLEWYARPKKDGNDGTPDQARDRPKQVDVEDGCYRAAEEVGRPGENQIIPDCDTSCDRNDMWINLCPDTEGHEQQAAQASNTMICSGRDPMWYTDPPENPDGGKAPPEPKGPGGGDPVPTK